MRALTVRTTHAALVDLGIYDRLEVVDVQRMIALVGWRGHMEAADVIGVYAGGTFSTIIIDEIAEAVRDRRCFLDLRGLCRSFTTAEAIKILEVVAGPHDPDEVPPAPPAFDPHDNSGEAVALGEDGGESFAPEPALASGRPRRAKK